MNIQTEILLKVLGASLAGIFIGLDRETSGKPAGIRTQMLVCVGSALLSGISVHLRQVFNAPVADPARLLAQIVPGIGFLGAGIILKNGNRITGVTTAATIWVTSSIGIAIGAGFYLPAVATSILVLLLRPLANIQYRWGLKGDQFILSTRRSRALETDRILSARGIAISDKKLKPGEAIFTIVSSHQRNQLLERTLNSRKIIFSLERKDQNGTD